MTLQPYVLFHLHVCQNNGSICPRILNLEYHAKIYIYCTNFFFSVPVQLNDDPFLNAPLSKGLNKKRLASPRPSSPAHQNTQKPEMEPSKDHYAIHEDLLCLSMDTSPSEKDTSETEAEVTESNGKKAKTSQQPKASKGSPQMASRSVRHKPSPAAELEALEGHPVMEPKKSDAETQPSTPSDNVLMAKPTRKLQEPFDFVSDLLKTPTLQKDIASKSVKMKMSKSADTGLSNMQSKLSTKTRPSSKGSVPTCQQNKQK